jgi:hypothetical protein
MQGTTDTVQWIKIGGADRSPPWDLTVAMSPILIGNPAVTLNTY